MNVTWIFSDGLQRHTFSTFPYAFRMMFNSMNKRIENGENKTDLMEKFIIISPFKKVYTYLSASELAQQQGLLNLDGTLNKKEFKKPKKM